MKPRRWNVARGIAGLALRRHFNRGHFLALGLMLAVLALIFAAFLRAGNGAEQFLAFNVEFYFAFLVPLLAFIGGGGAWRDELKPEAADYFLLRGVPRGLYLALRYGAHLLCAEADFIPALALLAIIAATCHVPGVAAALPAMAAAQVLAVAGFSAFGFFCAALTARWVVLGLIYGVVIEFGVSHVPLAISRIAMSRQVRTLLHGLATPTWSNTATPGAHPAAAALALALFAAGFAAGAALLFRRQELAGEKSE
ncbi:MAG TPA: hypothetical protein VHV47_08440 [Opitutaceae bacterium]|jgi:ABC-type transport system involved in multi-copper enzyme maturation permease subunit|nr:hypothetical protein [Opitutaceae bacterium]